MEKFCSLRFLFLFFFSGTAVICGNVYLKLDKLIYSVKYGVLKRLCVLPAFIRAAYFAIISLVFTPRAHALYNAQHKVPSAVSMLKKNVLRLLQHWCPVSPERPRRVLIVFVRDLVLSICLLCISFLVILPCVMPIRLEKLPDNVHV